mgnify:CR=1 FL=1
MDYQTTNIVDYIRIGQRIQNHRKEKGLSQEQLSEQIGISLSFLGHIERGTRKASVETLARICKSLDVDMHYIVFGYSNADSAGSKLLHELEDLVQRFRFE